MDYLGICLRGGLSEADKGSAWLISGVEDVPENKGSIFLNCWLIFVQTRFLR